MERSKSTKIQKKNGEYNEYYKNGNIKVRCFYVLHGGKSVKHGEYIEYYESGNTKMKCFYILSLQSEESVKWNHKSTMFF